MSTVAERTKLLKFAHAKVSLVVCLVARSHELTYLRQRSGAISKAKSRSLKQKLLACALKQLDMRPNRAPELALRLILPVTPSICGHQARVHRAILCMRHGIGGAHRKIWILMKTCLTWT